MRIKRIHRITLAVRDVDAARATFERLFAAVPADGPAQVPAFGIRAIDLRLGEDTLQLAAPMGADNPVMRFLERKGEGFYNIALEVDDLDAAVAELAALGVRVSEPSEAEPGVRSAFVTMVATHGLSVQLVELPRAEPDAETPKPPDRGDRSSPPQEAARDRDAVRRTTAAAARPHAGRVVGRGLTADAARLRPRCDLIGAHHLHQSIAAQPDDAIAVADQREAARLDGVVVDVQERRVGQRRPGRGARRASRVRDARYSMRPSSSALICSRPMPVMMRKLVSAPGVASYTPGAAATISGAAVPASCGGVTSSAAAKTRLNTFSNPAKVQFAWTMIARVVGR